MELASRVDSRLWSAIESAYDGGNYTTAVLEAMHFLGQLIRDRSGLEGDGQSLVGAAFGGKTPVLKVNQLQTDSDWNVQHGIEQILRGLYQAVRNPRSHEKHTDTLESTEALILFINYLIALIDQAVSPFEKTAFLKRVFDAQFLENRRYAELLVAKIPPGQRYNVLIEAYRERKSGRVKKLAYFFAVLLKLLTTEQIERFCELVSEELSTTENEASIRFIRQILPDDYWLKLTEIARLRVEGMFISSIKEGTYDSTLGQCMAGAFGSWAGGIETYFLLKDELEKVLAEKLNSGVEEERSYVLQFFFGRLTVWLQMPEWVIGPAIHARLEAGDEAVRDAMKFVAWKSTPPSWKEEFSGPLEKFVAAPEPTITDEDVALTDDDVPF